MPKNKTHRGAAKRFRKTGSGKIKFKRAYLRHCLSSQQTSTKRALRKPGYLCPADARKVEKLLNGDY